MVSAAGRLYRDHAPLLAKKLRTWSRPQLLAEDHYPGGIRPVRPRDQLRQIQTNRANIARGRAPRVMIRTSFWRLDAVRGPPPHRSLRTLAAADRFLCRTCRLGRFSLEQK